MTPFFWLTADSKYEIKTIIKKSSIPDAGCGRFSLENVKKGELIRKAKIIHIKDYLNLKYSNESDGCNYFIIFSNYDDINMLFEYFKSFNLLDENEIKLKMSWFIGHIDDKLYIQSHSSYYNHSNNSNIKYEFDNDYIYQYASKDIKENEELYIDYNNIKLPEYYLEWCKDNNLSTCISIL
jgi:SET domain-containing protein